MIYRMLLFLTFIAASWVSTACCEEASSRVESLFQELRQYNLALISEPDDFDVQDLVGKFKHLGIDEHLANLSEHSDSDLNWLFRSVSSIVFYEPKSDLRGQLDDVFEELDRRGALQVDHLQSFYQHIVRAGELDYARAFALKYDHLLEAPLPVVPEMVDGEYDPDRGPSVLKVLSPDLPLVRKNLELHDDVTIIVQFDPECGFSSQMISQMAADDDWKRFVAERAYLLATQPTDILRLEAFHAWNQNSPFEVFLVEHLFDWPFISRISTPSFYVLRNGEEVDSFGGYTSEALDRLLKILVEVFFESQSD